MDDLFDKLFNSSLHFLSYRPRSEFEVRKALIQKRSRRTEFGVVTQEIPDDLIEKVINQLKEHKFLNDEEFVEWWIDQRTRVKPKGIRVIKIELKKKGIPNDLIEAVFDNKAKLQIDPQAQLKLASKLVQKRLPRVKGFPKQEQYRKLGQYLGSRGFDFDTIRQAIDEVLKKGV